MAGNLRKRQKLEGRGIFSVAKYQVHAQAQVQGLRAAVEKRGADDIIADQIKLNGGKSDA